MKKHGSSDEEENEPLLIEEKALPNIEEDNYALGVTYTLLATFFKALYYVLAKFVFLRNPEITPL